MGATLMSLGQLTVLIVGMIGALGVGTMVGAVIQSRSAAINLEKQLAHELATRRLDHEHELEARRLDDLHRLRDQRLTRLREGFLFLVQALLQLEDVLAAMERGLEPAPGEKVPEWQRLLVEANRKAEQARAGLLLEKLGEPAMRRYVDLGRKLRMHYVYIHDVGAARQAKSGDVPAATERYMKSDAEITQAIVDQIRQAQEALEQLEAPIRLAGDDTGDMAGAAIDGPGDRLP